MRGWIRVYQRIAQAEIGILLLEYLTRRFLSTVSRMFSRSVQECGMAITSMGNGRPGSGYGIVHERDAVPRGDQTHVEVAVYLVQI